MNSYRDLAFHPGEYWYIPQKKGEKSLPTRNGKYWANGTPRGIGGVHACWGAFDPDELPRIGLEPIAFRLPNGRSYSGDEEARGMIHERGKNTLPRSHPMRRDTLLVIPMTRLPNNVSKRARLSPLSLEILPMDPLLTIEVPHFRSNMLIAFISFTLPRSVGR